MTAQEIYLNDLAFNVKHWEGEIKAHKRELNRYEEKLQEISQRNSAKEIKKEIEHFQNRIIREREVIDELTHKLKLKRKEIKNADTSKKIDGTIKRSLGPVREEVKIFTKLNKELQHEIADFFMEWM